MLSLSVAVAGCGSSTTGTNPSPAATSKHPPFVVHFSWGTFKLNPAIATKIQQHKPLNIVLSYQILSELGAPAQLRIGLQTAAAEMSKQFHVPINARLIGPTQTDPAQQIAEVQALLQAHQIDALGIEPVTPNAFASVINQAMADGVPVFTVNTDSPLSHRIAYYGVNDSSTGDGETVAHYTITWLKQHHIALHTVALETGDDTAAWAQGRMEAWLSVMKKAYPHLKVYGTPTNTLTTGYNPPTIYADTKAFLTGHPNVQFIFDTDWGGAPIAKAIEDAGLKGKTWVIGYNVDGQILDYIGTNTPLIATADQNYTNQAEAFVKGASQFLLAGKVPSSPMQYLPVQMITPSNVAKIRTEYAKALGITP